MRHHQPRRYLLITAALLGAGLASTAPAQAMPVDATPRLRTHHVSPSVTVSADRTHPAIARRYHRLRARVVTHHGDRAPGRDIARWGVLDDGGTRPATRAELVSGVDTLARLLAPTSPAPRPLTQVPPVAAETIHPSALPAAVTACESGDDYGAYNPSSGAYGRYQIIPSTAAAHGCDLATPAGQDVCAARILATEGTGAWDCAG